MLLKVLKPFLKAIFPGIIVVVSYNAEKSLFLQRRESVLQLLSSVAAGPVQTVPPLPLLWRGIRTTLPCKLHANEEKRRENEKVAARTLHVRT